MRPLYSLAAIAISAILLNLLNPVLADPALLNSGAVDKTFEQNNRFAARGSIDGTSSGWAIESFPINQPDGTIDQSVVWPLASPISMPIQGRNLLLNFTLSCTSAEASKHSLGHFQLSYTVDTSPDLSSAAVPMIPNSLTASDPGIFFTFVNAEVIVGGVNPNQVIYEVQIVLDDISNDITGFRLDVFDENGTSLDALNGLPTGGPGRASNGNFVLTHVNVDYFYVIPARSLPPIFERSP